MEIVYGESFIWLVFNFDQEDSVLLAGIDPLYKADICDFFIGQYWVQDAAISSIVSKNLVVKIEHPAFSTVVTQLSKGNRMLSDQFCAQFVRE